MKNICYIILTVVLCSPVVKGNGCELACTASAVSLQMSCGAANIMSGIGSIFLTIRGSSQVDVSTNFADMGDFRQKCMDLADQEAMECGRACADAAAAAQATQQPTAVNVYTALNWFLGSTYAGGSYAGMSGIWSANAGFFE